MVYVNYFKYMFISKPSYRKIVLLKLLFQYCRKLLREIGFNERDISRLNIEF